MSSIKTWGPFWWLALLLATAGTAGVAPAVIAPEAASKYEIPLKEFDLSSYRTPAITLAEQQVEQAVTTTHGGAWKVYSWNPQTGTPHDLYGTGAVVSGPLQTADEAVAAARSFMQTNATLFKAPLNQLRFSSAPHAAGKWAVHFQQTYRGIDVLGGGVHLIFTDRGRLFLLGSDFYPGISLDPTPSVPASVATEIARSDLPFNAGTDHVLVPASLLVLPVPLSETQVDYHLAWRMKIRTEDPLGVWATYVDAHTGEILWRHNEVEFVDFVGTTRGLVERPSYCEGQTSEPLPYLRVNVSGVGTTNADASGNWSLAYGGTDPHTVTADLYSPYVDVNVYGGTQGSFTGTATPGTPLQVSFTDVNSRRDEKDVYQAVQDVHNFFQGFDPAFPYVNARITANVGVGGTCNAYWDGTINFYNAGGGCANTGQIMGVVYHEFCHGITNSILGSQGTQGIGEGNSDILANLITQESIIGRGFYLDQCSTGIRDSHNNLQYPGDLQGEVHHDGQIIAGFNWDAMVALEQVYGTDEGRAISAYDWHFGRVLRHPTNQPDQVLATFIADDDDGDLTNGTPHYDELCLGATNHGFTCPEILTGVIIQHTPLATRTEEGDAQVVANIHSTVGPLVPDSLRIRYRINGGNLVWAPMTPTGNPDEYMGVIPALTRPSQVDYYIRARDVAGNTRTAPPLAPTQLYSFDVATVWDPFEADNGWQVNLEHSDDAQTGIWVRADPVSDGLAQPEDDHTPDPGTICWVTGNAAPGQPAGTNDVDGGTTTLYSPVYDLTGSGTALVRYWRWYSNDLGGAPGADSWIVQVRNNGGAWTDIENTMQSSDGWLQITYDLAAAFGADLGTVQFKFIASDLNQPSLVEALVDDFEILAASSAAVPVDAARPLRFALQGLRPNPMSVGGTITFEVPVAGSVSLRVYDISGRLLRTLTDRQYEPGVHSIGWNGEDNQGHTLPSGVYFCRMEAGRFGATRSLTVAR